MMLDSFLEVAYVTQTKKQAAYELVGLMKELPDMELRKLAAGTPVAELYGHLDKTAYPEACGPDGQPTSFLDKFKGTPLFEQAVALEQQELQAEMTDAQKREERRQQNATDDSLYAAKDRLRVQKRLLELELAKQDAGGAGAPGAPPEDPMQAPGAPAMAPDASAPAPAEMAGKLAFAVTEKGHKFDAEQARMHARQGAEAIGLSQAHGGFAVGDERPGLLDELRFGLGGFVQNPRMAEYTAKKHEQGQNAWNPLGGLLTPSSFEADGGPRLMGLHAPPSEHKAKKEAQAVRVRELLGVGDVAGRLMAKTALAIPAGLGGMATKALGWAAKNPGTAGSIAGAGVGAAGGALAGGPDHRLSGALGGAAVGAGVGGMGAGTLGRMHAGQGAGQAAMNTARGALNVGMRGANTVAGKLPEGVGGRLSGLAQSANQRGHDALSSLGGSLRPKA